MKLVYRDSEHNFNTINDVWTLVVAKNRPPGSGSVIIAKNGEFSWVASGITDDLIELVKERDELAARVKFFEEAGHSEKCFRRDSVEQMAMPGIWIKSLDEIVGAVERVAKAIR